VPCFDPGIAVNYPINNEITSSGKQIAAHRILFFECKGAAASDKIVTDIRCYLQSPTCAAYGPSYISVKVQFAANDEDIVKDTVFDCDSAAGDDEAAIYRRLDQDGACGDIDILVDGVFDNNGASGGDDERIGSEQGQQEKKH